jgi:septum formation protein
MMLQLSPYKVFLASKSPRRQELLRGMDIEFEVLTKEVDETFPSEWNDFRIALMLAERKALAFDEKELPQDFLLIAADTIVIVDSLILNKPETRTEAIGMIRMLSGRQHTVVTAVSLRTRKHLSTFHEASDVRFGVLDADEIEWYVDKYKPYDKAGAYGIQEWIGYVAIASVEGSFFNVMGLPTHRLYHELKQLAQSEKQ